MYRQISAERYPIRISVWLDFIQTEASVLWVTSLVQDECRDSNLKKTTNASGIFRYWASGEAALNNRRNMKRCCGASNFGISRRLNPVLCQRCLLERAVFPACCMSWLLYPEGNNWRWNQDFETSVMHTTYMWCDHLNKSSEKLPEFSTGQTGNRGQEKCNFHFLV